jgi:hypothetical protein
MKKMLVFVGLALLWLPFFAFAETQAMYISQVQTTNGTGKTMDDFIELFNPNSQPLNLNGYRLVKRTASGTTDTLLKSWTSDEFIPAYSFYLWANSSFVSISATPNATTTGSIADNNGVAVRFGANDTGTIVDSVSWGSTNNIFANISATNPGAGQGIFRNNLFSASAYTISSSVPRNTSVKQFSTDAASVTEEATSTVDSSSYTNNSNTIVTGFINKSGAIKISEFLPNPDGEDAGAEKVELENTGRFNRLVFGRQNRFRSKS